MTKSTHSTMPHTLAPGERETATAVASMTCGCGKVTSKQTTLSGILDFVASAEASGWTFDAKGFVCCPECSKEDKP